MKCSINLFCKMAAITLGVSLISSCQADGKVDVPPPSADSMTVIEPGVPGGVTAHISTATAVVAAIDYKNRNITLQNDRGEKRTLTIGAEATNFNQIKVGDHVVMQIAEEMIVSVADKNTPNNSSSASMAAKAPTGEKPALLVADTTETTATVKDVDLTNHTATLQFEDGYTKTFDVRPDVALDKKQIGKKVVFRYTKAIAISVKTM